MVRLVFRPYTQLRRSICTSESLRTSIRVSPDFILARHSSPSFGSQHVCSRYSRPAMGHSGSPEPAPLRDRSLASHKWVTSVRPVTRTHVGMTLGSVQLFITPPGIGGLGARVQVLAKGPGLARTVFRSQTRRPRRTSHQELPPTSSWPGIVHHLSGPNMYALGTHRPRWGMQVPSLRPEGIGPQPA